MAAKSTKVRSAESAQRRKQRGEEILRLPVLAGTKVQLLELMQWHGIEQQAEAMTLMIHNLHGLGPNQSGHLFAVPRHEIAISENVARKIASANRKEARKPLEE